MTAEQMKECREQLATLAVARKKLAEVVAWLANNKDLEGEDPFVRPMDLGAEILKANEVLKFAQGQFMVFMFPGGIPQGV